jgi:RNA polymerase sigma factor (TIGR02999 family)
MNPTPGDVTQALLDVRSGGDLAAEAAHRLWAAVYGELRRMADRELRGGRGGETLTPTALVHEAYVKLVDAERVDVGSRTHFFALSCRAMRQVVVDHARRRQAAKRGGGERPLSLGATLADGLADPDALAEADAHSDEVVALDEALKQLAALDPRLEQVVECRYFGGLSVEETAEVMGASPRTVARDWVRAKAFLTRALAAA